VLFEATDYRIVIVEGPDSNGVLVEYPRVELAEGDDLMGRRRWRELGDKSDERWGKNILYRVIKDMGYELAKRTER
jgi:hypothetical protein